MLFWIVDGVKMCKRVKECNSLEVGLICSQYYWLFMLNYWLLTRFNLISYN